MTERPPRLDYAALPLQAPPRLTLVETPGGFSLVFPIVPRGLRIGLIVLQVTLIAALVLVALNTIVILLSLGMTGDELLAEWRDYAIIAANFSIYLLIFGYFLYTQLKWGHIPTVLMLEGTTLVKTGQGFWGIYRREWDVAQVKDVRLKIERNLFGSKTAANLWIHFHDRWPLRLRLRSDDPELPRRVETLLKQAIAPAA